MSKKFLLCLLVVFFTVMFTTQELQAKEVDVVSNLEIENNTDDSTDFFESELDTEAPELFEDNKYSTEESLDAYNKESDLSEFVYNIVIEAPELFPAELVYAKFLYDEEGKKYFNYKYNELVHRKCKHTKPIVIDSFPSSIDEKSIVKSVDMVWYSITENKVYSLVQELPYEELKDKVKELKKTYEDDYEVFGDILLKLSPHGLVDLYVIDTQSYKWDENTDEKVFIASYQAKEKDLSFDDFKKIAGYHFIKEKNWEEYQLYKLANFPKALELMAENDYIIPQKDFNFWEDIHVKVYDIPEDDKIDELDEKGETPLIDAVRTQKASSVVRLICKGADLNIYSTSGETALSAACLMGHLQYAKYLIIAGADLNLPESKSGMTPLMTAAMTGNLEAVKILLEAGADVNARQFMYNQDIGYNALKYAKENNNQEIADMLLQAGAQDIIDNTENTEATTEPANTIDNAVLVGDIAQVKKLLAQGENPNTEINGIGSLLYYACSVGNIDIVKELINAKADLNVIASTGYTPLMMAVISGQKEIVKVLLEAGADIGFENKTLDESLGKDALTMSKNLGQTEIFDLISSYKAQ